jgi:hypothetical protein
MDFKFINAIEIPPLEFYLTFRSISDSSEVSKLLGKNAKQTATSGRAHNVHVFCVERKCVIEDGFCRYVCPQTHECHLWREEHNILRSIAKPIYYNQRSSQSTHVKEELKPHTLTPKQHSVNFIPNQSFETSPPTIHQFNELRQAPWIGHVEGYKWPECECAACCSEMLMDLMQETYRSYRQKTQQSFHTQAKLT